MTTFDEAKLVESKFILNGSVVIDDDYELALSYIHNDFSSIEVCPFCGKYLASFQYLVSQKSFAVTKEDYNAEEGPKSELKICLYCAYWQWFYEDGLEVNCYGCPDHFWHCAMSKTKEFISELPDGCYSEIAVALRRNPRLCHSISPYELEKFIAAVFKANYKDCEALHVGRADDGGVDVIFVDSGNNQWLIQVKRRERESASEGVETVRNLLGAMVLKDSTYGAIVSTADHFTYRAYQAAGRASEKGIQIKLLDKGKLLRMVGPMLPESPWIGLVKAEYPDLYKVLGRKYQLLQEKFTVPLFKNL